MEDEPDEEVDEEPDDDELSLLSVSLTFEWRASDKLFDEPPPLQRPLLPPRLPLW